MKLCPKEETPAASGWRARSQNFGYCSRSQAAELIRARRVSLNGTVRRDPEQPVDLARDHIQVNGQRIFEEKKIS